MGGTTAALVGAHHPDLTRALILEDPAWIDRRPEQPAFAREDNPWRKQLEGFASQPVEAVMANCRAANPLWAEVELRPWAESKTAARFERLQGARQPDGTRLEGSRQPYQRSYPINHRRCGQRFDRQRRKRA